MEVRPRIRRADRVGTDRPSDPAHSFGEHEAAQRGCERRSTRSPSPSPERGSYPRQANRCYPKDPGQKVSEQAGREETNRQQPTPAETGPSQSHEGDKAPKRCRHMEWANEEELSEGMRRQTEKHYDSSCREKAGPSTSTALRDPCADPDDADSNDRRHKVQ